MSNDIKKSNKLHLSIVKGLDDENGYRSTEMPEDLLSCRKILGLSMAAKKLETCFKHTRKTNSLEDEAKPDSSFNRQLIEMSK